MNMLTIHKYNGAQANENKQIDIATKGYQDIVWLAGKVFLDRNFIKQIKSNGIDTVYEQCPYGDLSDEQRATFTDTFSRWEMRFLVHIWWMVYDHLRTRDKIIGVSEAWRP